VIQESTMQATLPLAPRNSMPSLVMAGAVALLALPSAVLAFSTRFDTVIENASADSNQGDFSPSEMDPRAARAMAARQQAQFMRGKEELFHFTPAGLAARPDRSVTVAVRLMRKPRGQLSCAAHPSMRRASRTPARTSAWRPMPIIWACRAGTRFFDADLDLFAAGQ
jgi:hypothetical protein